MNKAKTVEEYIRSYPKDIQNKLRLLRKTILEVASEAKEKISYGMPYYEYKGRLAYFAAAKNHIGLYVMPPTVEDFKEELKDYATATSTIRFPLTKELPINLIKKLIRYGVARNDKNAKSK